MRRVVAAGLLALAGVAEAQTGVIAGRVTDEAGAPLPGVSVMVEGTAAGAAADADGRFALAVPAGPARVAVSSLGYESAARDIVVPAGDTVVVTLALREAVLRVGEVVVSAERAPTATRTDAPIRLVPLAVSVVPAGVIEGSAPGDLPGALRTVPGVSVAGREHPFAVLTLRGFQAENTSSFRRNGIEFAHYYDPLQTNVERVEVLRGPASVLFGRIEPGGVVNLVTERPQPRRSFIASAEIDEWGAHRYEADATGPLSRDRSFAGRVNASAARVEDWRLPRPARETFVAPALSWQPRPAMRLVLEGEMLRARAAGDPGVAIPDTSSASRSVLMAIPRAGLFYGEPAAVYDWKSDFGMATFEGILAAGWSLRAVASAGRHAFSRATVQLVGMASPDTVARQFRVESTTYRYLQAEAALAGTVRTGGLTHRLTAGVEAVRLAAAVSNTAPLVQRGGELDFASIEPVSLEAPAPAGLPVAETLVEYTFADGSGVNAGLFVQDRMTLGTAAGPFHVIASARASHVTAGAEWFALVATDESPAGLNDRRVSLTAVTPGLGVLWEPAPWASAYASYGRSFNPIFQQVSPSGEPFDPTEGEGAEAGIKLDGRRGRAALTVFHLEKTGALSQQGDGSYVQTGRQRSRGIELEVVAEPIAGISIAGAYTFTDAVVTADEQVAVGSRLPGAPHHAAGAWAEVRPAGVLSGLALTAGARIVGPREALLQNTLQLPAHAVVDIGASFTAGRYTLQLAVDNVLDARYAIGADRHPAAGPGPALLVAWPGGRRSVRAGLEVRL